MNFFFRLACVLFMPKSCLYLLILSYVKMTWVNGMCVFLVAGRNDVLAALKQQRGIRENVLWLSKFNAHMCNPRRERILLT